MTLTIDNFHEIVPGFLFVYSHGVALILDKYRVHSRTHVTYLWAWTDDRKDSTVVSSSKIDTFSRALAGGEKVTVFSELGVQIITPR